MRKYRQPFTWRQIAGGFMLAIGVLIIAVVFGCNGGGQGTYSSDRNDVGWAKMTFDPQGRPIIEYSKDASSKTNNSVKVQSPPNAKQPTTFYTGELGTTGGAAGQWEPAAIDYVKKNEAALIYVGAGMIIAGIVLLFLPWAKLTGFNALGLPAIIGGVAMCFLPTVIASAGPWIAGLLVLTAVAAVLCGFAWLLGKKGAFKIAKERGNIMAGKLAAVGRTDEAIAARRATDPSYSKAVADGKTADADPIAVADPAIKLDVQ